MRYREKSQASMELSFPGPPVGSWTRGRKWTQSICRAPREKSAETQLKCSRGLGMAPAITILGVRVGHPSIREREQGLGSWLAHGSPAYKDGTGNTAASLLSKYAVKLRGKSGQLPLVPWRKVPQKSSFRKGHCLAPSPESIFSPITWLMNGITFKSRWIRVIQISHLSGVPNGKEDQSPRIPQTPGALILARLAWKREQSDAARWVPQASHSKNVLLSESEQSLLKS